MLVLYLPLHRCVSNQGTREATKEVGGICEVWIYQKSTSVVVCRQTVVVVENERMLVDGRFLLQSIS